MTNVCEFITAKDEVWSVAFESLDQPFNCPIKKVIFKLKKQAYIFPSILNVVNFYAKRIFFSPLLSEPLSNKNKNGTKK